jgi:ankyrin repeat protein
MSDRNSLLRAARDNDVAAIRRGLAAGEDPEGAERRNGSRPLHLAAQEKALDAAKALLEAGAEVDAPNRHGATPLLVAVMNTDDDGRLIALLREHGADPYAANAYGHTPVSVARRIANYPVAQFFADLD